MRKALFVLSYLLLSTSLFADGVIIRCQRPCGAAKSAVNSAGGNVTFEYKYVDAIAAEVSRSGVEALGKQLPAGSVRKDFIVDMPKVARDRDGSPLLREVGAAEAGALDAASIARTAVQEPGSYLINNGTLNLSSVHAGGNLGSGVKVAVIDTGIRPGFPHISIGFQSVIGGENFVPDGRGFSDFANNGHGTFVAGMIASHVTFAFSPTSTLLKSVKAHCPSCVTGPSANQVPMIGTAPLASIYALRVFGVSGGAPESRIIAAMERVLELRDNYDHGVPETKDASGRYAALKVKVCNMSLGGPTLYAGRDIEDQLTKAFLDRDIVLAVSAGNAGPSGTTGGSPGTGFGALTVGASSDAVHERVLRDLQFGLGIGALYRPFAGTQTAFFSSRGPTADGRNDPDVVANGFASYGQGFSSSVGGINIASGTSFSGPTVAGVAACLRQAVPTATARQVRNAIMLSANPSVLTDGSGPNDQGNGYANAAAALSLLASGAAPNTPGVEGGTRHKVEQNLAVPVYQGRVTRTASDLLPGQRFETYYRLNADTQDVTITLSDVRKGSTQNAFFGDDILLTVHSAKTSSIGEGDYQVFEFTSGGTFTITSVESGLMRVTLSGDWTNASPISATVTLSTKADQLAGNHIAKQKIREGDLFAVPFNVPVGAKKLDVRLEWKDDWSAYPTDDLDLFLLSPSGVLNFDGATLNSPETVTLAAPESGTWIAFVQGFSVFTGDEKYNLQVNIDDINQNVNQ